MASLIEIIIDADDRASAKFRHTSSEAKKMAAIIGGITIAASAMTPALLGGLGAIASLFGTAGIAAAGFGALAFTTMSKAWGTASDLEDAMLDVNAAMINNDAKGYAKAMAKVQAIWESMSESERKAVKAIMEFKDAWADLEQQMAPTTLYVMAEGLDFMRLTMTRLFPSFQGVGQSFGNMMAYMNNAITSGRVDPFFEHMNTFAVPMFERVMISAGNILKGFGGLMVAFAPLGLQFGDGMVSMTDKFAKWAWELQSNPGFQKFVAMVQESTPIIFSLIGTIVDVLWTMIETLYPFAIRVLAATDAFLKWSIESETLETILKILGGAVLLVAENMDWLIPLVGSLYIGMKALQIVQTVAKGFGLLYDAGGLLLKGLQWLIPTTRGMTVAQTALNIATSLFPGVWITAAIMAVVAAGILLWKNWDEIAAWGKWLWSETKKWWNNMKRDVNESYEGMVRGAKDWWADTTRKWDDTVNTAKRKATEMYNDVASRYESMKTDAKNKLSEMVADASNKWNSLVSDAWSWTTSMWEAGKANAKSIYSGFKGNMGELGNVIWEGMNSAFESIWSWSSTFYESGKGLLKSFTNGIRSAFNGAIDTVWEGLKAIRRLLPFSPAKEGPLSDLDKSGEAFFPTWYNAALSKTGAMQKAIGGAFSGVANEANTALASTGLEAFTGGATSVTVNHVVTVQGDVGLDAQGVETLRQDIQTQVVDSTGVTGFGFDKQVIRRN
ncbi:distal tail protein [Bacillus phage 1_ICo-2020]|uniref:Distal tail protein n=1 Tax=Bacillus phage 1_ICo-2020 TaxID=2759272 RepID=A0A7G8AKC9_9CAUD|nr:distal tail protein [Bacillus phage 1_ICo-2020]